MFTREVAPAPHLHDGDFHAATDHPDWAESGCFAVSVPERDLTGRLTYWTLTDWRWNELRGWGENQEFMGREKVRQLTGRALR